MLRSEKTVPKMSFASSEVVETGWGRAAGNPELDSGRGAHDLTYMHSAITMQLVRSDKMTEGRLGAYCAGQRCERSRRSWRAVTRAGWMDAGAGGERRAFVW